MTHAATYQPIDHVPASVRDRDCQRRDEAVDRRKALYRQAKALANALRAVTDRQRGGLTRSAGHVLSILIRQNLRACVRKELFYMPTRAALAKETGLTERTVSAAISRLKEAGLIVIARYGKGGRLGRKGRGLATEFRSGCLTFCADQLAGLGYRLPTGLHDDLVGMAAWAARQTGEAPEQSADTPRERVSTGKKLPGTLSVTDRAAPVDGAEPPDATVAPEMRLAEEYDAAQERGEVAKAGQYERANVAGDNVSPATAADLGLRRDRPAHRPAPRSGPTANPRCAHSLRRTDRETPRDAAMMRPPVHRGSLAALAMASIRRAPVPDKPDGQLPQHDGCGLVPMPPNSGWGGVAVVGSPFALCSVGGAS